MSAEEKVMEQIECLTPEEKGKVLEKIKSEYFEGQNDTFVVGENYNF